VCLSSLPAVIVRGGHTLNTPHPQGDDLKVALRNDQMMRQWFEFLDADNSRRISVDELEDPLISVGLAHSRRWVKRRAGGGLGEERKTRPLLPDRAPRSRASNRCAGVWRT
jgi:hypothetical protein